LTLYSKPLPQAQSVSKATLAVKWHFAAVAAVWHFSHFMKDAERYSSVESILWLSIVTQCWKVTLLLKNWNMWTWYKSLY